MKKQILVAALVALAAVSSQAQGTFNFSNYPQGGQIKDTDGTLLGSSFYADFVYSTDNATYKQGLSTPVSFAGQGYFLGNTATISDVAAGNSVYIEVRAWRAADGATYSAAVAANGHYGITSTPVQVTLKATTDTPLDLPAFTGFSLVPEPATVALGALGLSVLLFRRRK